MPYSPLLIAPMRKELSSIGFTELLTAESVDAWMAQKTGTALLAVNSASGASAGFLRPALTEVLQRPIPKPERLATVFAGQDVAATERARSYFGDVSASEPSVALFLDGEMVYFVPRYRIEGRDRADLIADFAWAFVEYRG